MPSGLRFQKRFLWNILGSKSWRSISCSFTEIVFSISAAFSISDSLLHICSNLFSCRNVFIPPLYQIWQTWAYSLMFVQLACWHTDEVIEFDKYLDRRVVLRDRRRRSFSTVTGVRFRRLVKGLWSARGIIFLYGCALRTRGVSWVLVCA